jgi:hypothetical protein
MNNFFAQLRDLHMENAETGREENSTKTSGLNESTGKRRPPPIVLTLEANFISLQREKKCREQEVLLQSAIGTRITTQIMVDYNATQKFLT